MQRWARLLMKPPAVPLPQKLHACGPFDWLRRRRRNGTGRIRSSKARYPSNSLEIRPQSRAVDRLLRPFVGRQILIVPKTDLRRSHGFHHRQM